MERFRGIARIALPLAVIAVFTFGGQILERLDLDALPGEKSFTVEEIQVEAALRRDGVLLVREQVTYDFKGDFTVGTRDFDAGPWQITGIRAFDEDGDPLPTLLESPTLFEWDIAPATGLRTYEVRYQVRNAVLAWPDVVELNWQWVGVTSPRWASTRSSCGCPAVARGCGPGPTAP